MTDRGPAIIAQGITVKGDLVGDGDIVVEGRVLGRVDLDSALMIERTGSVQAEIRAHRVTVRGRVQGDVFAAERIDLEATAVVEGDLCAPVISVEDGASIAGRVQTGAEVRR